MPKAQGLADWLALDLPPWLREEDKEELMRLPGVGVRSYGRDLVGRKGLEAVSRRVQAQLMAEGQKPLVGEGELEKGPQVRGGEAVQR